jgi:hypothetical protein
MNTRFRHLVVLVCFVATVAYADSQGYIVPNGITYSSAGSMAVIDVLQNPTNGDFARFILKPEFKTVGDVYDTIFSYRLVLGESVRTFLASPNDPISLPSIEAGSYSELSMGSYYGFDLDVPFYLGVYTGYTNGVSAGLYNDPVFGWAEFVNHQGMIQLLDSALVMEGGGIYVGTQTIIPVPEPGELSLFVVRVFMLGYWAKRHDLGRRQEKIKSFPQANRGQFSEFPFGHHSGCQRGFAL